MNSMRSEGGMSEKKKVFRFRKSANCLPPFSQSLSKHKNRRNGFGSGSIDTKSVPDLVTTTDQAPHSSAGNTALNDSYFALTEELEDQIKQLDAETRKKLCEQQAERCELLQETLYTYSKQTRRAERQLENAKEELKRSNREFTVMFSRKLASLLVDMNAALDSLREHVAHEKECLDSNKNGSTNNDFLAEEKEEGEEEACKTTPDHERSISAISLWSLEPNSKSHGPEKITATKKILVQLRGLSDAMDQLEEEKEERDIARLNTLESKLRREEDQKEAAQYALRVFQRKVDDQMVHTKCQPMSGSLNMGSTGGLP